MIFFQILGDREGFNAIMQADNTAEFNMCFYAAVQDMFSPADVEQILFRNSTFSKAQQGVAVEDVQVRGISGNLLGVFRIERSPVFKVRTETIKTVEIIAQ